MVVDLLFLLFDLERPQSHHNAQRCYTLRSSSYQQTHQGEQAKQENPENKTGMGETGILKNSARNEKSWTVRKTHRQRKLGLGKV